MTYTPNVPQPTDFIDESQPFLLANYQGLDSTFDVDHYKFSDATGDIGKHKTVTTPDQGSHQSTATDEPSFYANEAYSALGVLQWSRGGGDATPTPVTALHGASILAASASATLYDCAGMGSVMGEAMGVVQSATDFRDTGWFPFFFSGTNLLIPPSANLFVATQRVVFDATGTTSIQITNNSGSSATIDWTLKFHRID